MKPRISAEDFLLADDASATGPDDHTLTAEAVLELAKAGKLRGSNDLKDFSAEMMGALLRREVTVGASREMRQWAELIYSLIQTEAMGNGGKEINFIGQLIQMSGVSIDAEKEEPKQIVDVQPIEVEDVDAESLFAEIESEAI